MTQSGKEAAPATKYSASNGPLAASASNTSATKNRKSVAGRAADTVGDEDDEQAPESFISEDPAQAGQQGLTGGNHRFADADAAEGRQRSDQQQRRQYPAQSLNAVTEARSQHGGQRCGENDTDQAETFPCCGQPRSQDRFLADVRTPCLVGHAGRREAEVGQRQRAEQPERDVLIGRIEERDEADGKRQQGQRHHARPGNTVGQPAEPGVDAGIEQTGAEEDETEQRQLHAGVFGVVTGDVDVDREGCEGQGEA